MSLLDYLLEGLGLGLYAGGVMAGFIAIVGLIVGLGYVVGALGASIIAAIVDRPRRLEPGVDRPYGIDTERRP